MRQKYELDPTPIGIFGSDLWVILHPDTSLLVAVLPDGRRFATVFTIEEYAAKYLEATELGPGFTVARYTWGQFLGALPAWREDGVVGVAFDADHAAEQATLCAIESLMADFGMLRTQPSLN